jgi:hypothetical protein
LVVAQSALATMLLAAGGLLIHSLAALASVDSGCDPSYLLTRQVALSGDEFQGLGQERRCQAGCSAGRRAGRFLPDV